jgi:hypothetical protein
MPSTRSSSLPAPNGHRLAHVGPDPVVGQERHPRVVEGVVPDQVALQHDALCGLWIRLGPAPLHEEGRGRPGISERVEDPVRVAGPATLAVGVLCVERQRDPLRELPVRKLS